MKEVKDYLFMFLGVPVVGMTLYEGYGVVKGVSTLKETFPKCFK